MTDVPPDEPEATPRELLREAINEVAHEAPATPAALDSVRELDSASAEAVVEWGTSDWENPSPSDILNVMQETDTSLVFDSTMGTAVVRQAGTTYQRLSYMRNTEQGEASGVPLLSASSVRGKSESFESVGDWILEAHGELDSAFGLVSVTLVHEDDHGIWSLVEDSNLNINLNAK